MNYQEKLREQVKIIKAKDSDYTYKEIAGILDMTEGAFYNWLSGTQNLGYSKIKQLEQLIADLQG